LPIKEKMYAQRTRAKIPFAFNAQLF